MKPKFLFPLLAASLLAALPISSPLAAQTQNHPTLYIITDLGTLGGTYSYGYGVNNAGMVTGGAATPAQNGGSYQTAFLWYRGHMFDLGTLGGPACPGCNSEGGGPNMVGESVLISETAKADPNGEDFCGFGTHRQCLGATWKSGSLTALFTLPGGQNAQAYWVNSLGQVAGFSENGIQDATCSSSTPFQVLRYEAVIWAPSGQVRLLRPLEGDTVAFAFGINDMGQAVGSSGLCSNTSLPPLNPNGPHAVLWERDGTPVDLGNLGGASGNVATGVNNLGQVVGNSQSTDGTIHPFVWTRTAGMHDLGSFPGAVFTVAPCCNTLNNRGEVVGFSMDSAGNMRAFVWKGNVLTDLNTLLPPGSPWYLINACSINDAGQIAGAGVINGEVHAFLATPMPAGPR